jgi:hypothetical protein
VLAMLVVMAFLGLIGYLLDRSVDRAEVERDRFIPGCEGMKPVGSHPGHKGEGD